MIAHFLRSKKNILAVIIPILFFSCLIINGCRKNEEKPAQQNNAVTDTAKPQGVTDTQKLQDSVTDVKGKYSGTFDNRSTILNITNQDGNKFSGSITINYRDVINQKVSGEFNPDTKTFSMTDLLHSRFQGKYSGKFSPDLNKMSGTFTMNLDGSNFSFNFNKK